MNLSTHSNSPRRVSPERVVTTRPFGHGDQDGIALVTTLLLLLLISAMTVGVAWLVMGDQKLGGNNSDRQLAFYGAEAGMESLTASLENLFDSNYAPDGTAVTALETTPGPPSNIPQISYIAAGSTTPGSGYLISFTPTPGEANIPLTQWGTIPTGAYSGLVGLMTPYTLTVTARTTNGSEAKLQRQVQTVAIPVFQFGFFSQMDLAFFAGPNFNFGGRVASNGNLWLAEGPGDTLTMSQKVTAAGEIITANLENGWPATAAANYGGAVNITNGSGVSNLLVQSPAQSVTGTTNYYGNISSYAATFKAMANSIYNNNIGVQQTGVQPLNLSIATPAIGGQPIDLLRWPQPNENTTNPGKLEERYYGNPNLSLRILLSDYDSTGSCANSPISSTSATALPNLSANTANPTTPVDLATLAWDTSGGPYTAAPAWLSGTGQVGKTIFPLPVSDASAGVTYSAANGYWIQQYYPIITGCIKIEYQSNGSPGTWTDVTGEILKLGYTGRNIDPQINSHSVPAWTAPPTLSSLIPVTTNAQVDASGPTANTSVVTVGCSDPSPNAVIRFARVRDNPSNGAAGNNYCGNNPSVGGAGKWYAAGSNLSGTSCSSTTNATNCPSQLGTDYWPNVLYDPRESVPRDVGLSSGGSNTQYTLAGAMYYIELDVKNLANWFAGNTGSSGKNALNTTGYGVYFSDRRNEQPDSNPPASVVASGSALTGGYGFEDIINGSADANGCPDNVLESGEDVESDYINGVSQNTLTTPKTYGKTPTFDNVGATSIVKPMTLPGTGLPAYVLASDPNCAGTSASPFAVVQSGGAAHPQELRENPPLLFRRALKLVDADTINVTSWPTCNAVACGLTIASENPVYVQGCYNNPGECNMTSVAWSATSVGASVVADAVTLLSDNWNDVNSFTYPFGVYSGGYGVTNGGRNATTTTYRMAVAAGKGLAFKQPTFAGVANDYGTDGGAHNFLRYIENWGGDTLYYEGSIVSIFYNHQAEGIYKCCTVVYSPPTRGYQFDSNFLTPSLLPPLTPMLRTINTVSFTEMLLPTQ